MPGPLVIALLLSPSLQHCSLLRPQHLHRLVTTRASSFSETLCPTPATSHTLASRSTVSVFPVPSLTTPTGVSQMDTIPCLLHRNISACGWSNWRRAYLPIPTSRI